MFDGWNRVFGLAAGLTGEHFDLNTGTDVVLTAVSEPGDGGENNYNSKCGDTVVYGFVSSDSLVLRFFGRHTHAAAGSGELGREEEEDGGQRDVSQRDLTEMISDAQIIQGYMILQG